MHDPCGYVIDGTRNAYCFINVFSTAANKELKHLNGSRAAKHKRALFYSRYVGYSSC
jgi:hypothetical protein